MGPVGDNEHPTPPEAGPTRQRLRRSRMDPAALAAAAAADQIPIDRRWAPQWTVLLLVAVPAAFWAIIWFVFFR